MTQGLHTKNPRENSAILKNNNTNIANKNFFFKCLLILPTMMKIKITNEIPE